MSHASASGGPELLATEIDIEAYLARHEQKELVRFVTIGSVDDGKSTLIGRLLHDTHGIYDDQLAAVRAATKKKVGAEGAEGEISEIDFSLLTDGLRAEREQGITIDVAYRYFSTETRKFIIADTPGHEQYTRNMATGASTADIALILLDARLGVLPQSRRHAAIASFLGIPELVVCVNKMDLVEFSEARFDELVATFGAFLSELRFAGISFVPVSAKRGDNVVEKSAATPWYRGKSLLELLETLEVRRPRAAGALRFPVQYVIRPHLDYRAFAGVVADGEVRVGDAVVVLPSGRATVVTGIDTFDGSLTRAFAPMSVSIRLRDEVDVSRGDMLVRADQRPTTAFDLEATIVWMSEAPFDPARKLLMKHTSRMVGARVSEVIGHVSLETLAVESKPGLGLNDIARVRLRTAKPIFCDPYETSRATGAFILIDAATNATVAAGMIRSGRDASAARDAGTKVSSEERAERLGHRAVIARVAEGRATEVERALFDRGVLAVVLSDATGARAAVEAGAVVVTEAALEGLEALDLREHVDVVDHLLASTRV
ncbi:MAG: sulfate adenylyltransferase subunit CysN [Polyangiaceae bacterium]